MTGEGPAEVSRDTAKGPSRWNPFRWRADALAEAGRFNQVLGMNARNARIARDNPFAAVQLVNDKYLTKEALAAVGAPTAPTLALIRSRGDLRSLDWAGMPDSWALKPNQSLGGNGIMLAAGRDPEASGAGWVSASGRRISVDEVTDHVLFILDGEFSGRAKDMALFEPLIHAHPDVERLSYRGLPDVRVLCIGEVPVLAMTRLPTSASGGRANLHQGAIGAAVDLNSGRITEARAGRQAVTHHPDTGEQIVGAVLPHWPEVLRAASLCGPATGLHYVGADVVIDRDAGPLILEVNARPGLQIQNVTGSGLLGVIEPGGDR